MAKPTFVFVPGGFHTPGVYDKVISILEPQGYECIKVALPSISNELATKDISNDVEAIEAAVAGCVDEGKDVVFVAHSYGGVSTCQMPRSLSKTSRVSKDLKGGIIRIVIIAGFLVPEGFQTAPEGSIEAFPHDNFVVDVEV